MSESESLNPRRNLKAWQKVAIAFIVLAIIGQVTSSNSNSDTSGYKTIPGTGSSTSSSEGTSWKPEGFDYWDSEVAYKWVENPSCNSYSVCAAIQVIANRDCPNNLYAELLLQDKNYVQYDYTNEAQGSLSKGNTAELTFNFEPSERFAHFKLSKISCR